MDEASRHFKTHRDYGSLQTLSRSIQPGMTESAVTNLLGEADYWPVESQCYYISDRSAQVYKGEPPYPYTLVINFSESTNGSERTVVDADLSPVGE